MIDDKELDEIIKEREENEIVVRETTEVSNELPSMETEFSKKMEDVKQNILVDASDTDNDFVESVKKNIKQAALQNTENEKKKANYEGQKVDYASEQLDTRQKKNQQIQQEDKWENRRKRREYHYDGVKPIMKFVNIESPMNLPLLYLMTIILIFPFLISKLIKGTLGVLISGASNGDRPRAVKGFLWTILAVSMVCMLAALIYLFLKWQNII